MAPSLVYQSPDAAADDPSIPSITSSILMATSATQTAALLPDHSVGRKIYIQRDYSKGLGVRFCPTFPVELTGRIENDAFDFVITKVNRIFDDAERLSVFSVIDSLLGCLTAYLIFTCYDSYYDRCLKRVTRLIQEQNESVWKPKGLLLTDPKDRGLRCIEVTIFETSSAPNPLPGAKDLTSYQETALN